MGDGEEEGEQERDWAVGVRREAVDGRRYCQACYIALGSGRWGGGCWLRQGPGRWIGFGTLRGMAERQDNISEAAF